MSQASHPLPLTRQLSAHRTVALAALLALLATVAVVLVLAIDGGSTATDPVSRTGQPAARSDGGPEESAVAASVGTPASAGRPEESAIGASISAGASEPATAGRPDESGVAASISP